MLLLGKKNEKLKMKDYSNLLQQLRLHILQPISKWKAWNKKFDVISRQKKQQQQQHKAELVLLGLV